MRHFMSDYPKWSATRYIDNAINHASYTWKYIPVYEKSVFETIIKIKNHRVVIISKLNNFTRLTENAHVFFKLLCLTFLNQSKNHSQYIYDESNQTTILILKNIFKLSLTILFDDIKTRVSEESITHYRNIIKLLGDDSVLLCWTFILLAHKEKITDDLIEEYYLLKEIEAFKK